MLRVIHFSDFHLNKKNLDDWNYFIKDTLIEKLLEINTDRKIDLILMTGDLIDKGGAEFKFPEGSDKNHSKTLEGLREFRQAIITPILDALKLQKEAFLIIPGNHDLDQSIEPEFMELGLQAHFTSSEVINNFIRERRHDNFQGIERMRSFKTFEKESYEGVNNCHLSNFE